MKATHRKILDKIAQYLETEGAEHLRFTQALFNLDINQFDPNTEFTFRDNHNDSDEEIIGRIIMSQEKPESEELVMPVMRVKENVLYYTEDFVKGKLLDEQGKLTTSKVKSVELNQETIDKLLELLVDEETGMMHRCMSVYRDAIILNGQIYNICLSCGDYYLNDKRICIFTYDKIKELLAPFKNQ